MISWRKYVDDFDEDEVSLKVVATDIRFSYLQPDEVLIARDLLNKQIVDTRGMRVVRVNDLKLSDTSSAQLRLLGAEVGARGLLRSLSPALESVVCRAARALGHPIQEKIIAWNYMDLLERDLSNVKLSVSHKTLDELHPADIADIIERLDPRLRGQVFAQLDEEMAAEAMAELDDDEMAATLVSGMEDAAASRVLSEMDPDDAAELVSELDYERAEKLLSLMGVNDRKAISQLLGYREDTAGRIMTQEFVAIDERGTVADAVDALRALDEDFESVRYVYLVDEEQRLTGVVTLLELHHQRAGDAARHACHERAHHRQPRGRPGGRGREHRQVQPAGHARRGRRGPPAGHRHGRRRARGPAGGARGGPADRRLPRAPIPTSAAACSCSCCRARCGSSSGPWASCCARC